MTNVVKAILIAASIFFTLAIVSIGVIVVTTGQDSVKQATSEISGIQSELADQTFLIYENNTISGSQVLNTLRKYKDREYFGIYVETGKNAVGNGTWYFYNVSDYDSISKSGATDDLTNTTNESSAHYINPSGQFNSSLIYDSNNVIRGIRFIQQ
jgi:hypothetical protein